MTCCHTVRSLPGLALGVAVLTAVGFLAGPRPTPASPPAAMSDAEFTKLLAAVRPCAGEDDFDKITWLTSVWDARETAAKDGKQILLQESDGHPLVRGG